MVALSRKLALKLKSLPTSPGVYMFMNARGKIIYIGKAKNLRNRVRTYFQLSNHADLKTSRMVSQVKDLNLLATDNEIESLILEANLVREHKPRYNVRLKDDRHFPYIKITNEPFPRVLIVRRLEKDKAQYFGPYTSSRSMRRSYALLTRLFKIRSCNLALPPPEGKCYQDCLDHHINLCDAPCLGLQTEEDYREQVDSVIMVLSGKSRQLVERLTAKMKAASDALDYEQAGVVRDQIEAIKAVMVRQIVDVGEYVDRDIISVAREGNMALSVVMQIREGALIGRQEYQLAAEIENSDETVVETFVTQYYNHQPIIPEEIHLPLKFPETKLVERWLRKLRGARLKLVFPKVGDKSKLVKLAAANARMLLDELLIQRRTQSERTSKMVTSLKDALKLAVSPRTMVCFDISNTGATDAVGSCVFFENGRPKKSEYRHFKIKGVVGQDDYRMMREVIGRYFYRIREEEKTPPDLVVVDGGKGQLSSAEAELKSLGFDQQPVIGLAKRLEEVFVPGATDSLSIAKSSPALLLLKQIRDEAHRFAVTYNRKVRQKRTIKSALDDVAGIGPARRKLLLNTFGSVRKIKQLTVEQLSEVKGINARLARQILESLAGK
jgi:excinuclease ABC subunit C